MGSEIATATTRDIPLQEHTYDVVESLETIVEVIEQLRAMNIERIALVVICPYYGFEERGGRAQLRPVLNASAGSAHLLQNVRSLVRKTDRVFLHQQRMYFVLPGANEEGAVIVQERLWEALLWFVHGMGDLEPLRPTAMSSGYGAFPDPHASFDELFGVSEQISKRFGNYAEHAAQVYAKSNQITGQRQVSAKEGDTLPIRARRLGVPYLSLLPHKLSRRVQQSVNPQLAHELRCCPVGRDRNILTVAMLDPQDRSVLERLHHETGLRIFPVLTHPDALDSALAQLG